MRVTREGSNREGPTSGREGRGSSAYPTQDDPATKEETTTGGSGCSRPRGRYHGPTIPCRGSVVDVSLDYASSTVIPWHSLSVEGDYPCPW